MRSLTFMAFFLMLPMRSVYAQGQTTKQALKEFRGQILGDKLIVRGFSDDPITTFQWTGTGLSYSDPQLHTLGVLKADSVELQDNKLTISGERTTLLRDKDGSFKLDGGAHAVIVVDLQYSAAAQVLPALKAALFFSTIQDGLAALPPGYASLISAIPTPTDVSNASHAHKYKECPSEDQVFQRPSVLYAPAAEFSEEAKQGHFSSIVTVKMTVGEDGLPHDLWIFRPAGLGLDQKAGQAASKYKFHPATCDGKSVKTTLYMDVNFKML